MNVMIRKSILSLTLLGLATIPAYAGEVETTGAVRITPADTIFYNPTGITIGSYLYLYLRARILSKAVATRSAPTRRAIGSSPTAR